MRFILILIVLFTCAPAHAQEIGVPTSTEQTQRLLQFAANNDAFDTKIESRAKALFTKQFPGCASIDQAVRQLPKPYGELVFPATTTAGYPAPSSGIWVEHVKIRACNRVRQINMLVAGLNQGSPVILALLPGETLADPALQRDAERIGTTTITKSDATCADTPVAETSRLLGFKQTDGSIGKTDAKAGWFEEWDYRFCQKTVAVQLAFIPDENGTVGVKGRLAQGATTQTPSVKPDAQAAKQ